jgi:F-type H+-transporting ATPase subunit c
MTTAASTTMSMLQRTNNGSREKGAPSMNRKKMFLSLLAFFAVFAICAVAFGAEGDAEIKGAKAMQGWGIAIGAGLGLGLAAFGGGLGQGRAAAAALDGIARNPSAADKLFTPMILGLALIESLVIYSLIIAFVLVGKI